MLSCLKRRVAMENVPSETSPDGRLRLVVVKQPRRYFRFRYRSELGSTSHGVLQADSCSCAGVIECPTVEVTVPASMDIANLYIFCMLYEKSQSGKYQLSPHQLIYKRDKDKDKDKDKGKEKEKEKGKVKEKCKDKSSSRRSKEIQLTSSLPSSSTSIDDKRIMENHEFGIVASMAKDTTSSSSGNVGSSGSSSSSSANHASSSGGAMLDLSYTFELRDCFIQKTLSSGIQSVLEAKSEALRRVCAGIQFEAKHKRGPNGCIVYLGFTVCRKNPDTGLYRPYTDTVYSEAIRNGQNVCIEKIINGTVSANGGEEIVLVTAGIRKGDVQLRLYCYDRDSTTIWEQYLQKELMFERKNMITFKAPRYDGDIGDGIDHIRCSIEAIRLSDNVRSVPAQFLYKIGGAGGGGGGGGGNSVGSSNNGEYGSQEGVTLVQDIYDVATVISEPIFVPFNDIEQKCLAIAVQKQSSAIKFQQFMALNDAYKATHEQRNSIFHELIASGNVSCLYKLWHIPQLHNLMRYAINSDGENLLHYACKRNRSEFIHPLLALGDMLCGQDNQQRTPLHLAIEEVQHECVQQFAAVLACHMDYSEELDQLRELFFLHNVNGYTVMHMAVLRNLPELLSEMIEFCNANQMDLSSIRTADAGNSILHLAVCEKLSDMVRLIVNKVPSARFFINDERETVFDMKPVSKYENVIKILKRYDELYV